MDYAGAKRRGAANEAAAAVNGRARSITAGRADACDTGFAAFPAFAPRTCAREGGRWGMARRSNRNYFTITCVR